jgi:hypothetical protein
MSKKKYYKWDGGSRGCYDDPSYLEIGIKAVPKDELTGYHSYVATLEETLVNEYYSTDSIKRSKELAKIIETHIKECQEFEERERRILTLEDDIKNAEHFLEKQRLLLIKKQEYHRLRSAS